MFLKNTICIHCRRALVLLVFLFLLPASAIAHGFGITLSEEKNGFLVDVDTNALGEFQAGEPVNFSFFIRDSSTAEPLAYESLWVQLKTDDRVILATSLGYGFGGANLVYEFADRGQYALTARFQDAESLVIAESVFPITVAGKMHSEDSSSFTFNLVLVVAGGVAGAFAVIMITRTKKRQIGEHL
jgi:hypothetical protein